MAKTQVPQIVASTAGVKIKIFGGLNQTALEVEANQWFAERPNIEMIKQLLSTSVVPVQGDGGFTRVSVTIAIFYRECFQPRTEFGNQLFKEAKRQAVDQFEREYLAQLIQGEEKGLSSAAKRAGIEPHYLRDLLRKFDIRMPGES